MWEKQWSSPCWLSYPSTELHLRLLEPGAWESGAWRQLCARQFPFLTDREFIKPASKSMGVHSAWQPVRNFTCWVLKSRAQN